MARRILYSVVCACVVACAGCASIRPLGQDIYMSDAVRPVVAADNFCRKEGKLAVPVQYLGRAGEFVFRCEAPR